MCSSSEVSDLAESGEPAEPKSGEVGDASRLDGGEQGSAVGSAEVMAVAPVAACSVGVGEL